MLLFEDKYMKVLGSALAIGLVIVSIMMAISAAQMPSDTLSMAQSLDEDNEKAKATQATDIRPLSPKTAAPDRSEQRQAKEPKANTSAPAMQANSGGNTKSSGTQAPQSLPEGGLVAFLRGIFG